MRSATIAVGLWVCTFFSGALLASSGNEEGKKVYELTCKSCHAEKGDHTSIDGKHAKRKAPPMAMVKKHYMKRYSERDDFVAAVSAWAAAPNKDKALLKHAVSHLGLMPAQNFDNDTLKKVAAYIYDEDMGKAGCGKHGGKGDKHEKAGGMKCGEKSGKADSCGSGGHGGGSAKGGCCSGGHGSDSAKGGCCSGGHGEGKEKGACSH
ncbi:MAG: c-type cytochrome [Gammaproteobacteria bacterium]|nr:c-type cytochrome [Gammaproteobacteria bacterium]